MRAGLVTSHRTFSLVEMPEPTPQPGLAVVDIALCGICGTDLHGFLGHHPYNPAICGHEWTGTVRATGPDVASVWEGDRVVVGSARRVVSVHNVSPGAGAKAIRPTRRTASWQALRN